MKIRIFIAFFILIGYRATAQDTTSVFQKIVKEVKTYKIDTSEVPDDKITAEIKKLRTLKGGFNITDAMEFKIEEEIQKNESSKESLLKLQESFRNGTAKKWLDNAVIWIYREEFSYQELKQLVKFYKTSAGQKMASELPVIILKSLSAAEIIQERLKKN